MKKFLERYPWVQQAGCGVLICALLLSICLPLMGMRSAEPDNPILQAAPQEITVLQAGGARSRRKRRSGKHRRSRFGRQRRQYAGRRTGAA